jgi:hypothetical protein
MQSPTYRFWLRALVQAQGKGFLVLFFKKEQPSLGFSRSA